MFGATVEPQFCNLIFFFALNYYFLCFFGLFWYDDVKNNFKNEKKIVLMHFQAKSILKNNLYYCPKHPLILECYSN
jgi:hypothetical protein